MKNLSVSPRYSKSCKCDVCNRSISYLDHLQFKELDYLICNSIDCKRVMSQKPLMTSFQFNIYLQSQKKHLQKVREDLKFTEKVVKSERKQNQKILQTFLDNNTQFSETDVYQVIIPLGMTKLANPANERIKKYSEHLSKIIRKAIDNKDNNIEVNEHNDGSNDRLISVERSFAELPKLQIMADRLCEMCKGGCCPSGNDHAYLSVSTISKLIKNKPELSFSEIHDQYLSRVANKTILGACINQTELGCSLPREMRSNTCNGYYCESVKTYIDNESQTDAEVQKVVIAVQWNNTNWNRFDPNFENEVIKIALINETEIETEDNPSSASIEQ